MSFWPKIGAVGPAVYHHRVTTPLGFVYHITMVYGCDSEVYGCNSEHKAEPSSERHIQYIL